MGPKAIRAYDALFVLVENAAPGEKLPAERVLSERLGVGRTLLRQMLTRLLSENRLELRSRKGYYIPADRDARDYIKNPDVDALARHIASHPMSVIQAAFRQLGFSFVPEVVEVSGPDSGGKN